MENCRCDRMGIMIDCSRNAVMSPEFAKHMIDRISELGYNTMMLYTEDTYEVEGQPFFGHQRGRYSREELRDIDSYAKKKGVELVPCIQTLAHLGAIMRWECYSRIRDCGDILLAGDERTYELIDAMFKSISESFSSRTVNIGMDEAHMIGKGAYYDKFGPRDRIEILLEHVGRVSKLAEKYGFKLMMWGDMFFRLARADYYDISNPLTDEVAQNIAKKIPHNVNLIYWDYYSDDRARYDGMLRDFKALDKNAVFAGGFWTWAGFTPKNGFSIAASKAATESCMTGGVKDVFFTMWGDSGGECSRLAVLPSIFYTAGLVKGLGESEIKAEFEKKYGISFDDFMLLDLPGTPGGDGGYPKNPEKYLLYNDVFLGKFDGTVRGGENASYAAAAEKLKAHEEHPEFGHLFTTQRALCEVLAIKAELGVNTRKAYLSKDTDALKVLVGDYSTLAEKLEEFYEALLYQWTSENKPHGFDIQDIRLGGLKQRILHCTEVLEDYIIGIIDRIPELEEPVLHPYGRDVVAHCDHHLHTGWADTVTPNSIW